MSTKTSIVEDGEAPESDNDDEVSSLTAKVNVTATKTNNQQHLNVARPTAHVVSGEESDSDDEMEINTDKDLPPLRVDQNIAGEAPNGVQNEPNNEAPEILPTLSGNERQPLKYDTLLHRKLRDKNSSLIRHLAAIKSNAYSQNTKELKNITQLMIKSQVAIQDVSHNMRMATNDLFKMEDKIDIITSCRLLPEIKKRD